MTGDRPPRALLLDLDGVVTDTARAHEAAWRSTLTAHGMSFDAAAYARTRGRSRADSLRELLTGQPVDPGAFDAMLAEKDAAYRGALVDLGPGDVLPGTTELIDTARARGWPVAIAYSLVLLATAVALIALEFLGMQGAARIGAALITILVILRMADADLSLLVKGVAFIVIGCGFLAFNAHISRRRAAAPGGAPA